jgi:hypothetical protein
VICPIDEALFLSAAGSITIEANDVDVWESPPLSRELTASDLGAFVFLDDLDEDDRIYRYWRIKIADPMNQALDEGVGYNIGHIYVGDYRTVTTSNIARGFSKRKNDPSLIGTSINGTTYANLKSKYRSFSDMNIDNLRGDEHRVLEQVFHDLGNGRPFYVSLDPLLEVSATLDEMTFYAYFGEEPTIAHVFRDYYRWNFTLREAV